MNGKSRIVRRLAARCGGMAFALLANAVHAADASASAELNPPTAAQSPVEQIGTLDEVWVYGKRLSREIEAAEDDFFVLYNKLNKDSQYDVHCGRMALNKGSMLMVRACVPGFIVYNYGDVFGRVALGGCGGFGRATSATTVRRLLRGGGYYGGGGYYADSTAVATTAAVPAMRISSGSGCPLPALMMRSAGIAANVLSDQATHVCSKRHGSGCCTRIWSWAGPY